MPLLEAIEQAAAAARCPSTPASRAGAPTGTRSSCCSTRSRFDRVIVPATGNPRGGLSGDDLVWLLERAPAEVLILRPNATDRVRVTGEAVRGHF